MEHKKRSVQRIRSFNRFYTDMIGLLDKHLLNSAYSLAEARIMYEIDSGAGVQASQIMAAMHIDKSYLSRLLKKLEKEQLIEKTPSDQDARAYLISLTEKGLTVFNRLNKASDEQIDQLIGSLTDPQQDELLYNMNSIINLLKQK